MYAGDFTWDKESQAFYMRHKLSNGQFCLIAFVRYYASRATKYYVVFAVADKKKNLNGYFNETKDNNITLKMTGRCGLEALYWCRDRLLEFEQSVHLDKTNDTVIVVAGEDSKRLVTFRMKKEQIDGPLLDALLGALYLDYDTNISYIEQVESHMERLKVVFKQMLNKNINFNI